MRLAWRHEAMADRDAIFDHIAQDNPGAALELDELIEAKADGLLEHPRRGRPGRVSGTRELVVHRNYLLVYKLDGDSIEVVNVVHARKAWPPVDDGATDNG